MSLLAGLLTATEPSLATNSGSRRPGWLWPRGVVAKKV